MDGIDNVVISINDSANTYLGDLVGRISLPFSQWKRSSHRKILLALNIFVAFLSLGVTVVAAMGMVITFDYPSLNSGIIILD